MAQPLTDIANRLTPSVPIELTFGAQPIAQGVKFTNLFGHMAQSGGTGIPYQVYIVVNVGDPSAAQLEVDTLAGTDSQIGAMASAFIKANSIVGNSNFPAFRVVLIPFGVNNFGPNQEALDAVKFSRGDMFVSCYPGSDDPNFSSLLELVTFISGPDRDLQGQFGSHMVAGSLDPLVTSELFDFNSRYVIVAALPDTNTGLVDITGNLADTMATITSVVSPTLSPTGTTTSGSATLTVLSSTAGIFPGASITGTGIPSNTVVKSVTSTTLVISQNATATASSISFTVNNAYGTIGIYPGASITGDDIPDGTVVVSVTSSTILMSNNAGATTTAEDLVIQNLVSQPSEIIAAAHAGAQMSSAFPYNPLTNVVIGGLIPPKKTSDWVTIDPNGASEQALNAGLSPLKVTPDGKVAFIRTVTTYTTLPDNVTRVTAYFDWQDLVVLNDFREQCYQITQNPPFNNNPGGTKASLNIAALLRDEILRIAQSFEDQGAFQGVQSLASQFLVANSTTSRGRFDFKIPVNVIPGLFVIAGNIQAVTTFDFTL